MSNILTVAGVSYVQTQPGVYVLATGPVNLQDSMRFFSTPSSNLDAKSTYKTVYTRKKDFSTGTAVVSDLLTVGVTANLMNRSFTSAELAAALSHAVDLFTNATTGPTNVDQWVRGVRDFTS